MKSHVLMGLVGHLLLTKHVGLGFLINPLAYLSKLFFNLLLIYEDISPHRLKKMTHWAHTIQLC